MLPFFKKSEDFVGKPEKNFHGVGGELKVSRERFTDPIVKIFLEAGEELGHPVGDINGVFQDSGFTVAQTNTHQGFRVGAFEAFAEQFVGGNLTVMTHAHVTRVLIEEGRAVGVEVDRFGDRLLLKASREVVLSAGTIGTPQILMLSGIGDGQHLKEVRHIILQILRLGWNHWLSCLELVATSKTTSCLVFQPQSRLASPWTPSPCSIPQLGPHLPGAKGHSLTPAATESPFSGLRCRT